MNNNGYKLLVLTKQGRLTYREIDKESNNIVDNDDLLTYQKLEESEYDFLKRILPYVDKADILNKSLDEKIKDIKNGENLDVYIDDGDWRIRKKVVKTGYGLEKLVDDEHHMVRLAVARTEYSLDKLVNDENPLIRYVVARQGYGLDILINDKSQSVRNAAIKYNNDNNDAKI